MDKGRVKIGKPPSVDFYDLQMEVFDDIVKMVTVQPAEL